MSVFFERHETDTHVVIRYKPWWIYVVLLLLAAMWLPALVGEGAYTRNPVTAGIFWLLIALIIWRFLETRGIRKEMFTAVKMRAVEVKGSQFNVKNPLTVKITKPAPVEEEKNS